MYPVRDYVFVSALLSIFAIVVYPVYPEIVIVMLFISAIKYFLWHFIDREDDNFKAFLFSLTLYYLKIATTKKESVEEIVLRVVDLLYIVALIVFTVLSILHYRNVLPFPPS